MSGSGSDSDGEPEVLSFSRGKKNFQNEYQQQKKAVDHEKDLLKEKRKKQHQFLIDQKETKLQRLDSKRLPSNLLEELDSTVPDLSLVRRQQDQPVVENETNTKEGIKLKGIEGAEKKVRRTKTTQFVITTVDKDKELTNKFQEKGTKFMRGCLFGKRTPRVASKTLMQNKRKQIAAGHRRPPPR